MRALLITTVTLVLAGRLFAQSWAEPTRPYLNVTHDRWASPPVVLTRPSHAWQPQKEYTTFRLPMKIEAPRFLRRGITSVLFPATPLLPPIPLRNPPPPLSTLPTLDLTNADFPAWTLVPLTNLPVIIPPMTITGTGGSFDEGAIIMNSSGIFRSEPTATSLFPGEPVSINPPIDQSVSPSPLTIQSVPEPSILALAVSALLLGVWRKKVC